VVAALEFAQLQGGPFFVLRWSPWARAVLYAGLCGYTVLVAQHVETKFIHDESPNGLAAFALTAAPSGAAPDHRIDKTGTCVGMTLPARLEHVAQQEQARKRKSVA
jgi:hypothetical protein